MNYPDEPLPGSDPGPDPSPERLRRALALAGIGAIALGAVGAFAWTAGWLGADRLTAGQVVDAVEANGGPHPGFRRAHAKGVCITGTFTGSADGRALSAAARRRSTSGPVVVQLSDFPRWMEFIPIRQMLYRSVSR